MLAKQSDRDSSRLKTIEAVLDAVRSINGLLVVDEAYGEFAPRSATDLLGEDVPLVVTKTYSKTWAMAGARLGYLLGPAWLVEKLEMVVLPYHLDAVKQAAGLAALRFVDSMNARVAGIVEERSRPSPSWGPRSVPPAPTLSCSGRPAPEVM